MQDTIKKNFRLNFSALNGKNSKCNLKCFNCHKDYFDVSTDFDENFILSFTEAIRLIYNSIGETNNHFQKIHISGHAEPLMIGKERFLSEVEQLRKNFPDLPIALTTNGSYLKDVRDEFLNMGNTFINLSLHHIAYLDTKWFNMICELDEVNRNQMELNIIIDEEIIENIDKILSFAFSKKINLKFFHRLEAEDPEDVVNSFADLIASKLSDQIIDKSIDNNRLVFSLKESFKISIKLPESLTNRPEACNVCPVRNKCLESCWNSIRITPWYIKPCGVREDNVFFFSNNSKEDLVKKLKLGGKI